MDLGNGLGNMEAVLLLVKTGRRFKEHRVSDEVTLVEWQSDRIRALV